MIQIRRAVYEDIPNIMEFMDKHWKPGNILAKNRDFFEWQFLEDGKVNMFIGIDDETDKIYGMLGTILYNKSESPDISGCTWQTIKSENPMLGTDLQDVMWQEIHPRYNCSIGLTKKAVEINRVMYGLRPIVMQHYYRLANRMEYKIAKVIDKSISQAENTGYRLEPVCTVEEMKQIISEEELRKGVLSKDYCYINRRYFEHPVYKYEVWKIIDEKENSKSVLITREETANGSKMCKIIDFYGDLQDLGKIAYVLDGLMDIRQYEYIDVYSYGVPTEVYERGGFICCDENNVNIVPNYFHPFVQQNIDLHMMEPTQKGVKMFRGDGDQDRPC